MTSNAGSRRWRTPLAAGIALVFGLGLAVASTPALAGVDEMEPSLSLSVAGPLSEVSDEALPTRTGTQADTPIVVADKKNKNWNKNWSKNNNWNNNNNWNKNKNWNKNWGRNNWDRNVYVRSWKHRPYYGQFFGGIVLGSILTAAAVGVAPPPPRPDLCWYWSDPYMYRGYWDYCY